MAQAKAADISSWYDMRRRLKVGKLVCLLLRVPDCQCIANLIDATNPPNLIIAVLVLLLLPAKMTPNSAIHPCIHPCELYGCGLRMD